MAQKGTLPTFLTPGRRPPSLKTTLTKPQNVFLDNVSPVYMRSVSSPLGSGLSDIYTSPVLSTGTEAKPDEIIKPTTETVSHHSVKIHKSVGPKKNLVKHKNELNFDEMETQIIPGTLFKVKDPEKLPLTSDVLSDFDSHLSGFTSGKRSKEIIQEGNGRQYTASFCSSSSSDESVIAQSRSSVCDGCSSSTGNSLFSQPVGADIFRVGSNGDCSNSVLNSLEMSDVRIEALLDSHLSFEDLDADHGLLKSQETHETLQSKDNSQQLSLSNEQMIFLLLRMVLSKYKQLIENLTTERRISTSQRQSVAFLIQAIVLLSRRVKSTSEQWRKTQLKLNLIQREHEKLRRHQRKIYIVMCVLIVFNLCNIQAVKQRIVRIVKFFGIVENVRKINRFRKMIAENWRNIPSVLTDFWRIFIFRSSTRLKNY